MTARKFITLLTDYGYAGGFVGVCHGVALDVAPDCTVIDIDHSVPAQDVATGARLLSQKIGYMPAGVHVAVVDPGVGTARRPVAAVAGGRIFVGPDNGLLVWALDRCGGCERAVRLDRQDLWQSPRARTFDGRDIFVPVAAHLANGLPLSGVGTDVEPASLVRLPDPAFRRTDERGFEAEVIQIDGSGNVQLHAGEKALRDLGAHPGDRLRVEIGQHARTVPYTQSYAEVATGEALLLVDSDWQLSVGVYCGRADQLFGATVGALATVSAT